MADYAAQLRQAVDNLNSTSENQMDTAEYLKMVTNMSQDWSNFRKQYGNMCDDEFAFEKVGFLAANCRYGAIDAFQKYINEFERVLHLRETGAGLANRPIVKAFAPFLRVVYSALDDSALLCKETEDKRVAPTLLSCLDSMEFLNARDADSLDSDSGFGLHALYTLIFFANAMHRSPDVADSLNGKNAPAIISKYNISKVKLLALRATIAQSYVYVVSDPRSIELQINDDMLKFILETINRLLQRIDTGSGDFTLYGLLVYLHQLIRCSDACGKGLLRYGFLDSLAAILAASAGNSKGQSTPGEKRTCAEICWALALLESCGTANAKAMKAHPKLTAALEGVKLVRDDVAKAAEGALWQIKVKSERPGTARSRPGTAKATTPTVPAEVPKVSSRPGTAKSQGVLTNNEPVIQQKAPSRPGTAKAQPIVSVDASVQQQKVPSRPGTAKVQPDVPNDASIQQKAPSRPGTAKGQNVESTAVVPPATSRPGTAKGKQQQDTNKLLDETVAAVSAIAVHGGLETDLTDVKRQVMVSYTSHWKPDLVMRINDELRKLGVNTWIYNNEMRGDMYDEMAAAIETSAAILVCYSKAYSNSQPCHAELNYAREWNRTLIPVRLEDFRPRGWLGISLSGRMYYDFANDDVASFDTQIRKLADCILKEFDKLGVQ